MVLICLFKFLRVADILRLKIEGYHDNLSHEDQCFFYFSALIFVKFHYIVGHNET